MTTSKIKIIHGVNPWKADNGTVFYHDLEMENGDRGSIWKKKENAFTVWQELTYELVDTANWKKRIKEERKEFPRWWYQKSYPAKNYNAEFAMVALQCAIKHNPSAQQAGQVMNTADTMFVWLKNKSLSSNQTNNG